MKKIILIILRINPKEKKRRVKRRRRIPNRNRGEKFYEERILSIKKRNDDEPKVIKKEVEDELEVTKERSSEENQFTKGNFR